nr:MAG TPA: hypothetical protein [Caudoviricetes sp.]
MSFITMVGRDVAPARCSVTLLFYRRVRTVTRLLALGQFLMSQNRHSILDGHFLLRCTRHRIVCAVRRKRYHNGVQHAQRGRLDSQRTSEEGARYQHQQGHDIAYYLGVYLREHTEILDKLSYQRGSQSRARVSEEHSPSKKFVHYFIPFQ